MCRYEYEETTEVCPDCGAKLVEELPPLEDDSADDDAIEYEDWIEIGRLSSQQMAQMALEALRSKNIPAVILSGTGYFGQSGLEGAAILSKSDSYKLMVTAEFVEDADNEMETLLGEIWVNSRSENSSD